MEREEAIFFDEDIDLSDEIWKTEGKENKNKEVLTKSTLIKITATLFTELIGFIYYNGIQAPLNIYF